MSIVITEPEAVTPDLLTEILHRSYRGWSGHVSSVRVALTKTLPYSRVARLAIKYSDKGNSPLPDHLFLKLSTSNTPEEDIAYRENDFYTSVGVEMAGPPLVRCYDSAFSSSSGKSHLLLEDCFETHFQTDQGKHPSPILSELAVTSLARFHAYWWEHPKIGEGIGSFFDKRWLVSFLGDLEGSVTEFVNFLGKDLLPERRKAYNCMLRSSEKIWGRLTYKNGLTVTHGDTHWWNFLYPVDPDSEQPRMIDWQLWHIDVGPRDLAFLIALGGFAERKPELELHLLRTYYKTLVARGVQKYSWSDFWEDYRFSAIRNLNIPVIFRTQGKHPTTWQTALERAFQSYDELKCGELF
jgi:hypothetical protein